MLATGRSQSAFRLVTYINAIHPLTHLFDGYLVHSRGANASGFKAEGLARDAENAVPPGAHIRTDIDVPVLDLQTEGDMVALRAHLTHQAAVRALPALGDRRRRARGDAALGRRGAAAARHGTRLQGSGEQRAASRGGEGGAARADALGARRRRAAAVAGDRAGPDPAAADPIVRDALGNAKGGIRLPEARSADGDARRRRRTPSRRNRRAGARAQLLFPLRPDEAVRRRGAEVALPDARRVREDRSARRSTRWSSRATWLNRRSRRPREKAAQESAIERRPMTRQRKDCAKHPKGSGGCIRPV